MATTKIAITLDEMLVRKLDQMVEKKLFQNRSKAIQEAVAEKLERFDRSRLARECAKLDAQIEQKMAEEGMSMEFEEWPEY